MRYTVLSLSLTLLMLSSCVVPKKQYDELANNYAACLSSRDSLKAGLDATLNDNASLNRQIARLKADTAELGPRLRANLNSLVTLQERYDELSQANEALKTTSDKEIRRILGELDETRGHLQEKEDALNELARELEV